MDENSFTEVNNISYGKNVKNSFGGIIAGLILFVISVIMLWTNEGNLANQNKIANFVNKNAIPVESTIFDKTNNNKLISTSGEAVTEGSLTDGIITIPKALVLNREVEMYQWKENKETKTQTNAGGSTTETTTYTYDKVWSDSEIDSSDFHNKYYVNPKFTIRSERLNAQNGTFGEFKLTNIQTSSFHNLEDYTYLPANTKYTITDNYYYSGSDINSPKIGDIRISYSYMPSGSQISVIGMQRTDKSITSMVNKYGKIYIQYDGLLSQSEMVEKFKQGNALTANIFRIFGFILMFIGLNLMLRPLAVVLSFIPFFQTVVSAITGGLVFLVSLVLSLIVIAFAWLFYRPLLTVTLLVVIAVPVYLIINKLKLNHKNL